MTTIKKYISGLSLIIVGFIIGFIFVSLLSMEASKIYMETVRIRYLTEQEVLAVHAQENGNLKKAFIHYNNLVYATSLPGIRFFESVQSKWSFSFPLVSIVLQKIRSTVNSKTAKAKIEGINRGKLAVILETLGKKNEAEKQYKIAANLMDINNIEKVKKIIKHIQKDTKQNWLSITPLSLAETPSVPETE